jgi:CRISPR-associated protein Csx10
MKALHLSIQPLSPMLTSSGQGAVLVDADAVFHPNGFPYIPARRLKGLLRESLTEVLEIMDMAEGDVRKNVNVLFGDEGEDHNNGKLAFGNAYVNHWDDIKKYLIQDGTVSPEDVKSYLATEVQQTALEEGIAKRHSLRNYRVVLPRDGLTFVSDVSLLKDLSDSELHFLKNAVSNLRYIGSRRNRGFGQVKCRLSEAPNAKKGKEVDSIALHFKKEISEGITSIDVSLRTDSPVIISRQDGDNNTLQTDDVVSGSQLRGALARLYMRKYNLGSDRAHLDEGFHNLFLSGRLTFGYLHHRAARAMPAFVHREKYVDSKEPLNVFHCSGVITKAVGGFGTSIKIVDRGTAVIREVPAPKKTSQFHNSRPDRTAGRNTGGQLFYYESLDDSQIFKGCIKGDRETLRQFCQLFSAEEQLYLGRSKSAQYGKGTVCFKPNNTEREILQVQGKSILLVAETPLVLTNEWGHPALNESTFLDALNSSFKNVDGEIKVNEVVKVAGSITHVEHYNGVWHAKNGKYPAYAAGTTFLVNLDAVSLPTRLSMGRFNELGYGVIRILPDIESISTEKSEEESEDPCDGLREKEENRKIDMPAIVKSILEYKKEVQTFGKLEKTAIEAASKVRGLNNHQCGRIERLMQDSQSIDSVHKWIEENKDKPIWNALNKAHVLINNQHKADARIPREELSSMGWVYTRHYWKAFFSALRKMNKS